MPIIEILRRIRDETTKPEIRTAAEQAIAQLDGGQRHNVAMGDRLLARLATPEKQNGKS